MSVANLKKLKVLEKLGAGEWNY